MDLLELIKTRRSVREYQDKPIPREALEQIVGAAASAPTARAIQPWEFVLVTKPEVLNKLADIVENGRFISQAKACIAVFCSNTKYYLEDGCAATVNILLAARSLGIGSCWIAGDKKPYCNQVANLLGVPLDFKLVSLISLGYPKADSAFRLADHRKVNELLHWERF